MNDNNSGLNIGVKVSAIFGIVSFVSVPIILKTDFLPSFEWLSFWGSYIGSFIGAVATFIAFYFTYKANQKQNQVTQNKVDEQKKILILPLLTIFETDMSFTKCVSFEIKNSRAQYHQKKPIWVKNIGQATAVKVVMNCEKEKVNLGHIEKNEIVKIEIDVPNIGINNEKNFVFNFSDISGKELVQETIMSIKYQYNSMFPTFSPTTYPH